MNNASTSLIHELRPKIMERRARLQAVARSVSAEYVHELLAEIDAALQKMDNGSYGLCETCHDAIEADRLERNPLVRFCLDHLTEKELRAHEQDLELATQIQVRLLPARAVTTRDWETHYRYEPAGVVGGDYCEVVASGDGNSLFFALGDVAGKGVAASLLMTHLSAIFRSLLSLQLPLAEVMSRANRLFARALRPRTMQHWWLVAPRRMVWSCATLATVNQCSCGRTELTGLTPPDCRWGFFPTASTP